MTRANNMPEETPFHSDPLEYEVTNTELYDIASNPLHSLAVQRGDGSRIFKRRFIKKHFNSKKGTEFKSVLVGELDGVRVYVINDDKVKGGLNLVLTKEDLYL